MAWTDAARAAALATRQANAAQRAKQNNGKNRGKQVAAENLAKKYPGGIGKPGPQTTMHPNGGNRAAFAVRNRLIHDATRPQREAAVHQRNVEVALSRGGRMARSGLLGVALGLAGEFGKMATSNLRGRR